MTKKLNWLLCLSALLFVFSCNNPIAEEVVDFENNLANANSNENIAFKLLQIYSEPNLDTRTRMFDSQKSDEKCFEFVYPISFILPDGSEVIINNDEDWDQIDLWYDENKDAEEEPEIIYPFDVVIDEDVKTITNKKDIEWLEEYCYEKDSEKDSEKDYDEKCFEFVYPISFILPDGSEVIINNDEDWDQIDLWYEENKDAEEEPEIIYPFDVVIDEDVKTITNKKDFQTLEDNCG
jgi:HKD family nuclease